VIVAAAPAAEGTGAAGKVYAGVTVDGALGTVVELDAYTGYQAARSRR